MRRVGVRSWSLRTNRQLVGELVTNNSPTSWRIEHSGTSIDSPKDFFYSNAGKVEYTKSWGSFTTRTYIVEGEGVGDLFGPESEEK